MIHPEKRPVSSEMGEHRMEFYKLMCYVLLFSIYIDNYIELICE